MALFLSIGSGPGIGMATAERFAAEDFHAVLSSRNMARLDGEARRLRAQGCASKAMEVDVSDAASIQALIASVLDRHGAIDVVHYNVAALRQATIIDQPADSFLADLSVNIAGAMVAIQAVSASMFAQERGTILLTGGRFGLAPVPDYISLSIGKAGIRALALGLFEPFRSKGVHVGMVTVAGPVAPASETTAGIAEQFWRLHSAEPDAWVAEAHYR